MSVHYKHRQRTSLDGSEEMDHSAFNLNHKTLKKLLLNYGEYPSKYRMLIWRYMLELPENKDHFEVLYSKGIHFTQYSLHKRYPISNSSIFRKIQRIISALANLSPIFGTVDYLPEVLFPFLKVFNQSSCSVFEIVATFFANWGKEWFEFFPNAPVTVMNYVASLLQISDNELLEHFVSVGLSPEIYVWSLLKSVFTEVFSTDMWLKAFDHIFSMPPSFMFYFICAYLSYFRKTFFQLKTCQDLEDFFHTIHACDLDKILHSAYDMHHSTFQSSVQRAITSSYGVFSPLQKGQYVLGLRFPKHSVDFQMKQREKIARSEEEIDIARTNYEALKKHNTEFEIEHRNWLIRQRAILEASRDRQQLADQIERELLEEKERVRQLELQERLKNIEFLQERRKILGQIQEAEANILSQAADQRLHSARQDTFSDMKHMTRNMHLNEVEKMEESKRMDYHFFVEQNPPEQYTPQPTAAGIAEMHPRHSIASEMYQTPQAPTVSVDSPHISKATILECNPPIQASDLGPNNNSMQIPSTVTPPTTTLNLATATNESVEQNTIQTQPNAVPSSPITARQDSQLSFAEGLNVHMLGKEITSLQQELDSLHEAVGGTSDPNKKESNLIVNKEPPKEESTKRVKKVKKENKKQKKEKDSSSQKKKTNTKSESPSSPHLVSNKSSEASTRKKKAVPSVEKKKSNTTTEMSVQTERASNTHSKSTNGKSHDDDSSKKTKCKNSSEIEISTMSEISSQNSSHHDEHEEQFSEIRKSLSQQRSQLERSEGAMQHIENLASYISQQTKSASRTANSASNISKSVSSSSISLDTSNTSQVYSRFDYLEKVDQRVNHLIQKKFQEFISKREESNSKKESTNACSSPGSLGSEMSRNKTISHLSPSTRSTREIPSSHSTIIKDERKEGTTNTQLPPTYYVVEEKNLSYPTTNTTMATSKAMGSSCYSSSVNSSAAGNGSSFLLNATAEPYSSDSSSITSNKRVNGVRNRGNISSTINPHFENGNLKFMSSPSQRSDNDSSSDVNSLLRHSSDFETIGSKRVNASSQPSSESSNSLNVSLMSQNFSKPTPLLEERSDTDSMLEKPKTSSSMLTGLTSYPSLSSSVESIQMKPQDYSSLDLSFFSTSSNEDQNVTISTSCLISDE